MDFKVGDRVGAIHSANAETKKVELLGYGEYLGECVVGEDDVKPCGFMGMAVAESGMPNPKIKLDDGSIIWGCECWWGGEEGLKKKIKEWTDLGFDVITVDMRDIRKNWLEAGLDIRFEDYENVRKSTES